MTFKTSSKKCAEIDAASKDEEHLLAGITHPGLHDCLCGRGGHATNHPGNVQFRMLVNQYKDYYMGLSRYGKLQVAAEVVRLWRAQTPNGRFLAMTDPAKRESTTWHDIGDKEAVKKTSQCLRERIPPNQKARTLKVDDADAGADAGAAAAVKNKKKKTSALKLRETLLNKTAATEATEAKAQKQPAGEWERTQLQLLLEDECQEQPTNDCTMIRPQLAMSAPTSATPLQQQQQQQQVQFNIPEHTSIHNMNMNLNMPQANENHLQRLKDNSSTSYTQALNDALSSNSNSGPHKRVQSWSGVSVGSWNANDEFWGMNDDDDDEEGQPDFANFTRKQEQAITGMTVGGSNTNTNTNYRYPTQNTLASSSNSNSNCNGHNVDSTLVPSAANLTQNVFDDDATRSTSADPFRPSRMLLQQQLASINGANLKSLDASSGMGAFAQSLSSNTTLNQTLSSGLSQLFRN